MSRRFAPKVWTASFLQPGTLLPSTPILGDQDTQGPTVGSTVQQEVTERSHAQYGGSGEARGRFMIWDHSLRVPVST